MLEQTLQDNIGHVLQEMRTAYDQISQYSYMNSDYAGFATIALARFRDVMGRPELTEDDLAKMLRSGINSHRSEDPKGCWAAFVASRMAQTSNVN